MANVNGRTGEQMLNELTGRVTGGEDLSMQEMSDAIHLIMDGKCEENEIGLLLMALRAKGETVDEVAGAADAMRRHMTKIQSNHVELLDTCGTGGSGRGTFNISTASALVTAAAGVPVAKHGNRAMSSKTGSADVLAELGVNIEASIAQVERSLNELGICFCFAPLMHQAMKHVVPVRKKLGVRTIFNLLGPLCNPAGACYQLLGVGIPEIRPLMAGALERLGTKRALVVSGEDGMDEVSLGGQTNVTEVGSGSATEFTWDPTVFGLESAGTESMKAETPAESAAIIRRIVEGEKGAFRDVVVLNSAAALWLAGKENDPKKCAQLVAEAIDSGAAKELLANLVATSAA